MFRRLEKRNQRYMEELLRALEKHLDADVFSYYGEVTYGIEKEIKYVIEELTEDRKKHDKIYIILTTKGGDAFAVQRIVEVFRHFYDEVNFIIPDYAYSAGTLWCMSGDNIYMSYYSALGPLDPQVRCKDGNYVTALGYIDKINEFLDKSQSNTLSEAEFSILKDFDLAKLREYEQLSELSVELVKDWLVKYQFKDWQYHSDGSRVLQYEKEERAIEIATMLSDNKIWKSHGRPIGMEVLRDYMKLKIYDLEDDYKLNKLINNYYACLTEYVRDHRYHTFYQTRCFI